MSVALFQTLHQPQNTAVSQSQICWQSSCSETCGCFGLRDGVVMPLRSIQIYDALKVVGNEEAILVTYSELGHGCWDEAFSTPGLFGWLFGKRNLSLPK